MRYVKIETSDGETRWINLAQVSRVTSAVETGTGDEILVVIFADPEPDLTLRIHAKNEKDREAVRVLEASLDELSAKPTFAGAD